VLQVEETDQEISENVRGGKWPKGWSPERRKKLNNLLKRGRLGESVCTGQHPVERNVHGVGKRG